jgi:hypothetical protein
MWNEPSQNPDQHEDRADAERQPERTEPYCRKPRPPPSRPREGRYADSDRTRRGKERRSLRRDSRRKRDEGGDVAPEAGSRSDRTEDPPDPPPIEQGLSEPRNGLLRRQRPAQYQAPLAGENALDPGGRDAKPSAGRDSDDQRLRPEPQRRNLDLLDSADLAVGGIGVVPERGPQEVPVEQSLPARRASSFRRRDRLGRLRPAVSLMPARRTDGGRWRHAGPIGSSACV